MTKLKYEILPTGSLTVENLSLPEAEFQYAMLKQTSDKLVKVSELLDCVEKLYEDSEPDSSEETVLEQMSIEYHTEHDKCIDKVSHMVNQFTGGYSAYYFLLNDIKNLIAEKLTMHIKFADDNDIHAASCSKGEK